MFILELNVPLPAQNVLGQVIQSSDIWRNSQEVGVKKTQVIVQKGHPGYLKFRYKARYKPSDLLCPVTYEWVTMDKCTPRLEASKFARLGSDSGGDVAAAAASEDDVENTLVLYQGSRKFKDL